jgi:hypothetical protein
MCGEYVTLGRSRQAALLAEVSLRTLAGVATGGLVRALWALSLLALACGRAEDRAQNGRAGATASPTTGGAGSAGATGKPTDESWPLPSGLRVIALDVSGDSIYALASDNLYRVPKAGGEWVHLSRAQHWVHGLAFLAGSAYFVDGNAVARFDEARGAVETLYELGEARVWSVGAANRRTAFVTPGCGRVAVVGDDGQLIANVAQEVWDSVAGTVPVVLGADSVYCGGGIGGVTGSKIFRYRPPDGALEPFVDLGPIDAAGFAPEATALLELGDRLYFTRGYGVMRRLHSLESVPLAGGPPTLLLERNTLAPQDLRYHAPTGSLYWLAPTDPGLVRYTLATGELLTKAARGILRTTLAMDEAHLYFATNDTLERVALF